MERLNKKMKFQSSVVKVLKIVFLFLKYRIETKELRTWKLLTQSKVTHLKTIEVIFNIFFHESLSCFTSSRDEMFENYEFFIIHT